MCKMSALSKWHVPLFKSEPNTYLHCSDCSNSRWLFFSKAMLSGLEISSVPQARSAALSPGDIETISVCECPYCLRLTKSDVSAPSSLCALRLSVPSVIYERDKDVLTFT